MSHLFRSGDPSLRDYLFLGLFGAIYLGTMALILAPQTLIGG